MGLELNQRLTVATPEFVEESAAAGVGEGTEDEVHGLGQCVTIWSLVNEYYQAK